MKKKLLSTIMAMSLVFAVSPMVFADDEVAVVTEDAEVEAVAVSEETEEEAEAETETEEETEEEVAEEVTVEDAALVSLDAEAVVVEETAEEEAVVVEETVEVEDATSKDVDETVTLLTEEDKTPVVTSVANPATGVALLGQLF